MEKTERIAYFDYMRVYASIMIVFLHVASYSWYIADVNSAEWMILNTYKSLTDHAVLLFIMISGALFLGKSVSIKNCILKIF